MGRKLGRSTASQGRPNRVISGRPFLPCRKARSQRRIDYPSALPEARHVELPRGLHSEQSHGHLFDRLRGSTCTRGGWHLDHVIPSTSNWALRSHHLHTSPCHLWHSCFRATRRSRLL